MEARLRNLRKREEELCRDLLEWVEAEIEHEGLLRFLREKQVLKKALESEAKSHEVMFDYLKYDFETGFKGANARLAHLKQIWEGEVTVSYGPPRSGSVLIPITFSIPEQKQ